MKFNNNIIDDLIKKYDINLDDGIKNSIEEVESKQAAEIHDCSERYKELELLKVYFYNLYINEFKNKKGEYYLESYDNLNLKEVKKNFDYGDRCLLDYLEKFIPDHPDNDLRKLYIDVSAYNEIYANGWTINKLFDMGQKDTYWIKRANSFIDKYKIKYEDYDEHSKFFDKYVELRDSLLDNLGIDIRLLEMDIDKIPEKGFMDGEIISYGNELDEEHSYTVGRVLNMCHCVELHYYKGCATLEYGTKLAPDYWESDIEEIDWFNKNMSDDEIIEKLEQEFKKYFGEKEFVLMTINDKEVIF